MGRSFFGRASEEGRERERAVGGRRRHQLLDRRANDRLYMQTPPAAGRRLFPPQITQFALFLSRCARIPSLLFHYFVGDFGAAIFVSVKQKKKKKSFPRCSDVVFKIRRSDFKRNRFCRNCREKGKYLGFQAVVGGLLLPGNRWSGGRPRR